MSSCPHCMQNGITLWAKFWSGSASPAKCKVCGELSYVHSKYRHGFQSAWPTVVTWLVIACSILLLIKTNSLWWLVTIPFIWFAGNVWELAILPLEKITETEAKERKKFGNIFLVIIFILVLFGVAASNL
jgi:hypothetical protein